MTPTEGSATAEAQDVVVVREFAAPRELVWRAWTEPEYIMRWYGPPGMTSHACEIDLRVGGRYLLGLRSPEGFEYWNCGVYSEVVPPERFVASMLLSDAEGNPVPPSHYGMPDDAPAETTLAVTLEDLGGGRTRLTLRQSGWTDPQMAEGAGGGWRHALETLAEVLGAGLG